MSVQTAHRPVSVRQQLRIGCVSFLNAKPLIEGLDALDGIDLSLDVPSRLLEGLQQHRFDVALLPVIDYQRMAGLRLLTAGGIGCNGATLTVRIFSPIPVDQIQTLACDTDSHTSVALAKIILAERYGIRPRIVDFDFHAAMRAGEPVDPLRQPTRTSAFPAATRAGEPVDPLRQPTRTSAFPAATRAGEPVDPGTAQLLIGDKVVCQEPAHLPHQIDLGQAWNEMTGFPFVFAAWMARAGIELGALPAELVAAKRRGLRHVDQIIARYAVPSGWPADIARKYLTEYLHFDIGPRHLEAIRMFHRFAHAHGIIEYPPRPLDVVE